MATSALQPTPSQSCTCPVGRETEPMVTPQYVAFELWRLHETQRRGNPPLAPLEALLADVRQRYPKVDQPVLQEGLNLLLNALFSECARHIGTHRLIGELLIARPGSAAPENTHFSPDARKRYTGRTSKGRTPLLSPRTTERTGRSATN